MKGIRKVDINQDPNATNPYRRPFLILVTVICVSLLFQAGSNLGLWLVANDTNKIVADVDARNSPERQRAQEAYTNTILIRVKCDFQAVVEDALNQIAAENPGLEFDVDLSDENCIITTTTTRP